MFFRCFVLFFCFYIIACRHQRSPGANVPTYTFLTYNIRYDNPNDGPDRWALRRAALAAEALRYRPAVIGMQEVLAGQLAFLETQFAGYRRVGVGRDDGKEKGEFSPIFFDSTLFHLVEGRTFWLSPTPEAPSKGWDAALPRIAVLAVLKEKRGPDTLWVVNTHFDHMGGTARLRSAELIAETLLPVVRRGKKAIVMGDLNAQPDEPPAGALRKYFSDACPPERSGAGTFNGFDVGKKQFNRIDYVWRAPADWKAVFYDTPHPKTADGRHLSDHFPVIVRLRKNK